MASSTSRSVTDANMVGNESSAKKREFHSSHSPHSQTGPGHGVGGGRHIPSHSSGSVISNVPVTVGATSVVQLSSSVTAQSSSGVGLQVDNDTTMKKEGADGGSKYMRTNAGSESVEKPAETPPFLICGLCNLECGSEAQYQVHINGKKHLTREGIYNSSLALSEGIQNTKYGWLLGFKELNPPDINALSNAIDARVQQGGANDPDVLFGQLLMIVLSNKDKLQKIFQAERERAAQLAASTSIGKKSKKRKAQLPASTSTGRKSKRRRLSRKGVSKYTAHVEKQNPSREIKTELSHVPLGSNIQPGSRVSTQNEVGGSETDDYSKPVEPAHVVSQSHVTGKQHLSQLRHAHDPQALSGTSQQQALSGARVGLQALYPHDSNALSNATNAQVQQGDNDPLVLLD